MSYVPVFAPRPEGYGAFLATGGGCGGHEISIGGTMCCKDSTWFNSVYAKIKGASSLRYQNEKKVGRAMAIMLNPRPDEGQPNGLEFAAWERGDINRIIEVAPGFLSRLQRAAHNFFAIFPPDRWAKNTRGVLTDCTDDGWYNTFHIKLSLAPPGEEAIAAQDNILSTGNWSSPEAWRTFADLAIADVPGGRPNEYRGDLPQIEYKSPDLAVVEDDKLVPSAWTYKFMDLFAPLRKLAVSVAALRRLRLRPTIKVPLAKLALLRATATTTDRPEAPPPTEGISPAIWAAGLVVAAGGGYLWMRRRR